MKKQFAIAFLLSIFAISFFPLKASKIVGLIQVRNEENIIEQCLRALALYTDAIVVLDDGSFDTTVSIVNQLRQELHIETIIQHTESGWRKETEAVNRQSLLDAGRAIHGTHFITIDSDEMFMATCLENNWLRNTILSLQPGQIARLPMINVWNGTDQYRDDEYCSPSMPKWRGIACAFYDDSICNYYNNKPGSPSGTIHVTREPNGARNKTPDLIITDPNHGIIHFKCANLTNITIKKVWYMCLEYIGSNTKSDDKQKNAAKINDFYNNHVFKGLTNHIENIVLRPVPPSWYSEYSFFNKDTYEKEYAKKKEEILDWFNTYGSAYFAPLAMGDINWILSGALPSK